MPTEARSNSVAMVRAVSWFLSGRRVYRETRVRVETHGGVIDRARGDGQVTVDMGAPRFAANEIPFIGAARPILQPLEVDGRPWLIPSCRWVTRTPFRSWPTWTLRRSPREGPLIEHHRAFRGALTPATCRSSIALTFGCVYGNGALAKTLPAAPGHVRRWWPESARVARLPGQGDGARRRAEIAWTGGAQPVWMTGPAATVFEGE